MENLDTRKYYCPVTPAEVTRGDLPHFNQRGKLYFITFRLADSLPQSVVRGKEAEFRSYAAAHPDLSPEALRTALNRYWHIRKEEWLDTGYGSCLLSAPDVRGFLTVALRHFDGVRYSLHSFVIMPNHVHLLLETLGDNAVQVILHSLKGYTGRMINRMTGGSGAVWERESFDRLIRDSRHYDNARAYIRRNPTPCGPGTFTLWER